MRHFTTLLALAASLLMAACRSGAPSDSSSDGEASSATCTEPENPFDEGSGHYAGFEWAENNGGSCDGNSQSLTEGCEEYERQQAKYDACEAKKR